jgi:hypothetical protein
VSVRCFSRKTKGAVFEADITEKKVRYSVHVFCIPRLALCAVRMYGIVACSLFVELPLNVSVTHILYSRKTGVDGTRVFVFVTCLIYGLNAYIYSHREVTRTRICYYSIKMHLMEVSSEVVRWTNLYQSRDVGNFISSWRETSHCDV